MDNSENTGNNDSVQEEKLDETSLPNNSNDFDFVDYNNNNNQLVNLNNESKDGNRNSIDSNLGGLINISSQNNIVSLSQIDKNELEKINSRKNIFESKNNIPTTLNESICYSFFRDLNSIFHKIIFVLNPFSKDKLLIKEIKQWDLWGPLLFTIIL